MIKDLITKIVQEFDTIKPLGINDPRYVYCSRERGSEELIEKMERAIRRSESLCQLFSGHRGCGKTTELYRLRRALTANEPKLFVVYCEADNYLKLDDVGYTDVLLAIVLQLWQDAHAKDENVPLSPGMLETLWDDIKGIFGRFSPKEAEVEFGVTEFLKGKLTFEIKNNNDIRRAVRSHLRDHSSTLLEATNELIRTAKAYFTDNGYGGLVIIVDNLDRVFLEPGPDANRDTHQALFVDAADYLRDLACSVVYTIPPTVYALYGPKLKTIYGSEPRMLPMIPVAKYDGGEDERGIDRLIETIALRVFEADPPGNRASATVEEKVSHLYQAGVFDSEETVKRLGVASGGHIRHLIMLMQASCNNTDSLPITRKHVEAAIRDARDSLISSIHRPSEWEMLRKIAGAKEIAEPEACARLVENFAVLEYRDNEAGPWYDVNPLLREARQFKA